MSVFRVYSEKRQDHAVEARNLLSDLKNTLGLDGISGVRILNRYDLQNITQEDFEYSCRGIMSEPQVDDIYYDLPEFKGDNLVFAVEYLPGQFDQRADSCAQCISLATGRQTPLVSSAKVYVIEGKFTDKQTEMIKSYLINPVESRQASLLKPLSLTEDYPDPSKVAVIDSFCSMDRSGLGRVIDDYGLAMSIDDIIFMQDYFAGEEKRDPTITELRLIDTYWSDHCRHTTFSTHLEDVDIAPECVRIAWQRYMGLRDALCTGRDKPVCLMDMATIGAKALKASGRLTSLDESDEINACSVKVRAKMADGSEEDWIVMFKNETHNHPTEIEPFGGAATCLGGAIRDPLSGRSYVYQAMRITGAGNPLMPAEETLKGKLPQKKLVTTAATGYSSYGNQIGLATGLVHEIYHPGYVAKHMEVGAVVGAAPSGNIVRGVPSPGDIVILLGGRTGRDGCGGATGSSKSHDSSSLLTCGAEVQKGNPPEERKLQRLFRNPEASRMIKRCNDFGAGGVSVAVGELADGVDISLDAVPKKYEGLDGTELAISESQERMAVVVSPENEAAFISLADRENLEAVRIAVVTEEKRVVMHWNGDIIVDISREFLSSNGASRSAKVTVRDIVFDHTSELSSPADTLRARLCDLNVCSQKGLSERFDSTIGANTLLMPYGGRDQLTPIQSMAAKLPVPDSCTGALMSWAFDPYISERSPYHGAYLAVVGSVAKVIASGGDRNACWLSLQEYFPKLGSDPERWGMPAAALLGSLCAQLDLGIAAIGGKDSMSGSFEDLDVPPTLISFALSVSDCGNVISPEFKCSGNYVYLALPSYRDSLLPEPASLCKTLDLVQELISSGDILSACAVESDGIAPLIAKNCFGNGLGFEFDPDFEEDFDLFAPLYGAVLLESEKELDLPFVGAVNETPAIAIGGETLPLEELLRYWQSPLEPVYPRFINTQPDDIPAYTFHSEEHLSPNIAFHIPSPRILIPVFPGTNCEYDTAAAFERAGGIAEILVLRTRTPKQIEESLDAFVRSLSKSQILALPGGFSGGDEPEGSAKFITSFLRSPAAAAGVTALMDQRDGLMLGICNGFQALIKLGLLPYGRFTSPNSSSPTLSFNLIGRHQSNMVTTRICSDKSPWLSLCRPGELYTIPVSHGEGRFIASEEDISSLAVNGQIAAQYVDLNGVPSSDIRFNPNGSAAAIEAITSPDGRILGKMGHSERSGRFLYKNISGTTIQPIFEGAVNYFR